MYVSKQTQDALEMRSDMESARLRIMNGEFLATAMAERVFLTRVTAVLKQAGVSDEKDLHKLAGALLDLRDKHAKDAKPRADSMTGMQTMFIAACLPFCLFVVGLL